MVDSNFFLGGKGGKYIMHPKGAVLGVPAGLTVGPSCRWAVPCVLPTGHKSMMSKKVARYNSSSRDWSTITRVG